MCTQLYVCVYVLLQVLSGTVFAYSALVLYRRYLFDMSWHTLYIGMTYGVCMGVCIKESRVYRS